MDHSSKDRLHNLGRLQELQREHGDEITLFCSHDQRMLADAQAAMNSAPGAGLTDKDQRKGARWISPQQKTH
jgi:hypothetical protein